MEGEDAVDAASVQTWDAKGVHSLQISWDVVAKVAYPPLEAAVAAFLYRLHNKMHHVTGADVFQHHQTVRNLEHLFLLWF